MAARCFVTLVKDVFQCGISQKELFTSIRAVYYTITVYVGSLKLER